MKTIYKSSNSKVKLEEGICFKYYNNDKNHKKIQKEFCVCECLFNSGIKVVHMGLGGDHLSMPFFKNGDIFSHTNYYNINQINCIFKQLVEIVDEIHMLGVAHRDLKLENILVNDEFEVILGDFGECDVFRLPWESKPRLVSNIKGSGPYIAPEEYTHNEFSPVKLDVWALGIVYICLIKKSFCWDAAKITDVNFCNFLKYKKDILDDLPDIFSKILDPNPDTRITTKEIKSDKWFLSIKTVSISC